MKQLYVVNWEPNGTNDLLVVENGRIKNCIQSATFGIDVTKARSKQKAYACFDDVYSGHLPAEEYAPEIHLLLKRISKEELRKKLCVSPVDPDGSDLLERLKDAGIVIK